MRASDQQHIEKSLKANGFQFNNLLPLGASGGDRQYYLFEHEQKKYLACFGKNVKENEAFFYFQAVLKEADVPVPDIIWIAQDQQLYVQSYVGDKCLLDLLMVEGHTPHMLALYKKAIVQLAKMQVNADAKINYAHCLQSAQFDSAFAERDLNYFRTQFLDQLNVGYDSAKLSHEFNVLSQQIESIRPMHFMYRDFQGRNIMVQNEELSFIDFQGGMKGPLQYDLVSLLWQAKAQLPEAWKIELSEYYYNIITQELKLTLNKSQFMQDYHYITLLRLLQVMGAYGLRGLQEKKPHFISSIGQGLLNLKQFLSNNNLLQNYPELQRTIQYITQKNFMSQFQTPVKLQIIVSSFSYKVGLPTDNSGNGGGFVFDCRGILNPGRFDQYKTQTGRDQAVIDFLEQQTKMPEFLGHIFSTIDISISNYIERNFDHLMISFGCTGGQHRSVYAADKTAAYIRQKYGVEVMVQHIEQEKKNWINTLSK